MERNYLKRKLNRTGDSDGRNRKFAKWKNFNRYSKVNKTIFKKTNYSPSVVLPEFKENPPDIKRAFDNNFRSLISTLEIPIQKVENKIIVIVGNLQTELNRASIPFTQIEPFGSSVTGLSMSDSDVDIFVRFRDPSLAVMRKIKNQLTNSNNFRNVLLIGKARVPIIKFDHVPTNTKGDLSVFSHLGCENTSLIKHYFSFDPNLRPMILFLKYFLKVYNIHGMGKINTYALIWLVIFHMEHSGRLPTVEQLQRNATKTVMVKSWNCSFSFEKFTPSPALSTDTFHHLLLEFFKFYLNFQFENVVMSTFTGQPISINDFTDTDSLPSCFGVYKRLVNTTQVHQFFTDHFIYLQDPFEHNLNVIKQASYNVIQQFRYLCGAAFKILQQDSTGSALNKLLNVATANPGSLAVAPLNDKVMITLKYKHFNRLFFEKDAFEKIYKSLRYVLEKVFLFQLTVYNQDKEIKELSTMVTYQTEAEEINSEDNARKNQSMIINVESGSRRSATRGTNASGSADGGANSSSHLNFNSTIVINCATYLDVLVNRNKHKVKRKSCDSQYEIDMEVRRSQMCLHAVSNEITVKIEFIPKRERQMIFLRVEGPPSFTDFIKKQIVPLIRNALVKNYNYNLLSKKPEVVNVSDDNEDTDKAKKHKPESDDDIVILN